MTTKFVPQRIFEILHRHGVRFVTIGGVAGGLLGSPLVTTDLDICYQREKANLERLAAALRELDAHLRGVDDDVPFLLDAATLKAGDHFTFMTKFGAFDILGTPSGSQGYRDLARRAHEVELGGFTVKVVSLDDLIEMKQAAGRAKDRAAVEILSALRDEIEATEGRR